MSSKRKLALMDLPNSESQVKMEDADLDIAVLKKECRDEEVNSPKAKKRRMSSPQKENIPSIDSGAKLLNEYLDTEEYRLKDALIEVQSCRKKVETLHSLIQKWENKMAKLDGAETADASQIKVQEIEEGWKKTLKLENGSTIFGAEEEGSVPSIKEGIALLKETLSAEQGYLAYNLRIADKHKKNSASYCQLLEAE